MHVALPRERCPRMSSNVAKPIIFSGPSGSGKSTLINLLFTDYPERFSLSVSHTSRKPRQNEVDGVHYHFVTVEDIQDKIQAGEFIEYTQFSGNFYGTSKAAVKHISTEGKHCVLDVDEQGVKNIKACSDFDAFFVFIAPPSLEALRQRLVERGTETDESLEKRMATASSAIDYSNTEDAYDKIIVNDDVEAAYKQLKDYLIQESIVSSETEKEDATATIEKDDTSDNVVVNTTPEDTSATVKKADETSDNVVVSTTPEDVSATVEKAEDTSDNDVASTQEGASETTVKTEDVPDQVESTAEITSEIVDEAGDLSSNKKQSDDDSIHQQSADAGESNKEETEVESPEPDNDASQQSLIIPDSVEIELKPIDDDDDEKENLLDQSTKNGTHNLAFDEDGEKPASEESAVLITENEPSQEVSTTNDELSSSCDTPSSNDQMTASDISKLKSMLTTTPSSDEERGSSNPAFDGFVTGSPNVGELPLEDGHDDDAPVIEIAENSNLIITPSSTVSNNNNNIVSSVKDIPLSPVKSLSSSEGDDAPAVMDVISSEKFASDNKLIDTTKSSVNPLEEEESSAWCGQKGDGQWCLVM